MNQLPWKQHYPSDVPAELAPVPFEHRPAMVKAATTTYAKTIAFTQVMPNGMNGSLTYAQVDELSDSFATYLREVLELKQGARVAVQMPTPP